MVYRWQCQHCQFSAWATASDHAAGAVKSHLLSHNTDRFRQQDFSYGWVCPYCGTESYEHDREAAADEFKQHLFDHTRSQFRSDVHLADDIDRTGSILIQNPTDSTGADAARIHLLTPASICVFVTTEPQKRLELIRDKFSQWPALTIIITTNSQPLSGIEGIDFDARPIEVVQVSQQLGLSALGETVSRVLSEHDSDGKISLEFDILPSVITNYDVQDVFRFLQGFTSRCERSDVLSHYYMDPATQSDSVMNVLETLFDMRITATGTVFSSVT